nr:hypothetical protein [uncultured Arsenicibacter sp.]
MRRLLYLSGLILLLNACHEKSVDPTLRVRPVYMEITVTGSGYTLTWKPAMIVCITAPCPDLADVEAETYEIQTATSESGPFTTYKTVDASQKSISIPATERGGELIARVVARAKGAPPANSTPVMATNGFVSQSAYYPGFGLTADVVGGDVSPDGTKSMYVRTIDKESGQYEFQTYLAELRNEQVTATKLITRQGGPGKFSPDGQQLVYPSRTDNAYVLYTIATGEQRTLAVTGLASMRDIAWSPDGKWLAYTTQTNEASRLWKIAVAGGNAIPLTPAVPLTSVDAIRRPAITWSPDGQFIVLSRSRSDENSTLWRNVITYLSAAGSGEGKAFDTQPGWVDSNPQFSPDGKSLAFLSTRTAPSGMVFSLWVRDLATGRPRRIELLPNLIPSDDFSPRWLGNDRLLFMATQHGKKGFFTVFL